MVLNSTFQISGHLKAIITNVKTDQVREVDFDNIVTQTLLNRITQWLAGVNNTGYNPVLPPQKFQLGTGTGTPALTDTNLFTPVTSTMVNISTSKTSTNSVTFSINYPVGSLSNTFTEAGLFDSNNVLLTHLEMPTSLDITSSESALFQYTLTTNAG